MQQHIEVTIKNKYGNDLLYPADAQAQKVCKLLGGQKTLTQQNVADLKAIGFEVRLKQPERVSL